MSDKPEERFRLFIDESGDHVFKHLDRDTHRYLCLLGCWFRLDHYKTFQAEWDKFRRTHFNYDPDEPLILHREDILHCRGHFACLQNSRQRDAFDEDLLRVFKDSCYRICAVVIDKMTLQQNYPSPAHPYNLALGFLLQRYCGYLNHINRTGDVMAESRGKTEDRELKDAYSWLYTRGIWFCKREVFQKVLTSKELKLKPKSANVQGLQIADLLAHPIRLYTLIEHGRISGPFTGFAERVVAAMRNNFNRELYKGRVDGYGTVLFPK
jgi:hypothetical protein